MNKITKQVTKELDVFVATDGREFRDRIECMMWDRKLLGRSSTHAPILESILKQVEDFNNSIVGSGVFVTAELNDETGVCEVSTFADFTNEDIDVTYFGD